MGCQRILGPFLLCVALLNLNVAAESRVQPLIKLVPGTQVSATRHRCQPNPLTWGADGHYIVGAVAMSLLSKNATALAQTLLPEVQGDISSIASWADQARFQANYLWSEHLHFINTPDWQCNYFFARDCHSPFGQGMCADGAIQNYTQRLANPQLPATQRAEALKFLTHFCGDIHQPLHVGFINDMGGNAQKGTFFNTHNLTLHHVWDNNMIEKRIKDSFGGNAANFASYLSAKVKGDWAAQAKQWSQCKTKKPFNSCSTEWAQNAISLACKYAYVEADGTTRIQDGFNLQQAYFDRNMPVIEQQLAKGGVRLATILNSIAP